MVDKFSDPHMLEISSIHYIIEYHIFNPFIYTDIHSSIYVRDAIHKTIVTVFLQTNLARQ